MALLAAAPAQVAVIAGAPGSPRAAAPMPPPAARAAVETSWRRRLSEAPAGDQAALLKAYVESLFAELLGLAEDHRVDSRAAFSELGMDSLLVVELRNRLQRDLEIPLAPTIAFDHPTIEALCRHLARELGFPAARPSAAEPAVPASLPPEQDLRVLLDELLAEDEGRWAP
jgi:epothilone polyketide synthase D